MTTPRPRLGLWLLYWIALVLGIVVPLALAAGGVWTWEIGAAVPSAVLLVLTVILAFVPQARPPRRRRRKEP